MSDNLVHELTEVLSRHLTESEAESLAITLVTSSEMNSILSRMGERLSSIVGNGGGME